MKNIHHHFSRIAERYRGLRTTDLEPILFIQNKLKENRTLAADIGCGAGRYDVKLFKYLGGKLFLYCIDSNEEMLKRLRDFLTKNKIKNFNTIKAFARKIPLQSNYLDCIFTFNAIHHFKMLKFLKESERILKNNGLLFIYTRLESQNRRNIWGKYFPLFNEKETRLLIERFKKSIEKNSWIENRIHRIFQM